MYVYVVQGNDLIPIYSIHYEMITTIKLINTSITSHSHCFYGENTSDLLSYRILNTRYYAINCSHHAALSITGTYPPHN